MVGPFELDAEQLEQQRQADLAEKRKMLTLAGMGDVLASSQSVGNFMLGKMNPESHRLSENARANVDMMGDPVARQRALLEAYRAQKADQRADQDDEFKTSERKRSLSLRDPNSPESQEYVSKLTKAFPKLGSKLAGMSREQADEFFQNPALKAQLEMERDAAKEVNERKTKLDYIAAKAKSGLEERFNPETGETELVKRGKTLPASEAQSLGAANAASLQLQDLDKLFNSASDITGPWNGRVSGLAAKYQIGDMGKRAAALNTAADATAQAIGTYLERGKLTDADFEHKYKPMMPRGNDSPEVRSNKVGYLNQLIKQRQEEDQKALTAAGYDAGGIPKVKAYGKVDVGNKKIKKKEGVANASDVVPPHGNTITQNGHTYTWNPSTGKYE